MKKAPYIYEYLDYRLYLKDYYQFKKAENKGFSYRSFARIAGLLSSNFLKLVMDGKRNLSSETIHRFAQALKLPRAEAHFFEVLVLFDQAKNSEEKSRYYERLAQFKSYNDIKFLESFQYTYFSNWYFVALRELVLLRDFKEDPKWINQMLGTKIHPDEIKRAIRILIELKLLYRDAKKKLRQTVEKISTGPEMSALAIINFHKEMLKKAGDALEYGRSKNRDISALTVSVSKKQFERIRERIGEMRREIHAVASESEDREAVYQVNFQLFNFIGGFMGLKKLFILGMGFLSLSACGGSGTEVVSPPSTIESKIVISLESREYVIQLDLYDGWSYIEYGPGASVGPNAFQDINPDTITVAEFMKDQSRFTLFFSVMEEDETFLDFIRERRPEGEIEFQKLIGDRSQIVDVGFYYQDEPGPRGGSVFDFYMYRSPNKKCVWIRIELVGDEEEQAQAYYEFNRILETIDFNFLGKDDGSVR